jgi:hypothetical protein
LIPEHGGSSGLYSLRVDVQNGNKTAGFFGRDEAFGSLCWTGGFREANLLLNLSVCFCHYAGRSQQETIEWTLQGLNDELMWSCEFISCTQKMPAAACCLQMNSGGKKEHLNSYPRVARFESASILLPVINETTSLRKTTDVLLRDVTQEELKEIIIITCPRTTPESRAVVGEIQSERGGLVKVLEQKLPFLGGALRDGFEAARGSHVVMMASDLETNPEEVPLLIAAARRNPSAIITTSRWISGGSFHGYSPLKLLCNWIFQRFFSLLFLTRLTDMTFGFRILPPALARAIRWEEVRHPFNLECIIKPLRLGVPVEEIPSVWHAREEGESQNSFFGNFDYFRIGFKVRFGRKESFLRRPVPPQSAPES